MVSRPLEHALIPIGWAAAIYLVGLLLVLSNEAIWVEEVSA